MKQSSETKREVLANSGYCHEVLDRLHVQMSVIDDHILTHPLVGIDKEVHDLISEALGKLMDAYQMVGSRYL